MKKIKLFKYLLLLLPVFIIMQSCTHEQKDYFAEASSIRLANFNSNARKVLRSAKYGWAFDVYPGSSQKYGGVAYTVKFDSLTATVRSVLDTSLEETSYYKMTTESGSAFIFDTFNSLIHYLSEGTTASYQAYGGDIEFRIDSVGTDVVKVHGVRSMNYCYLHRLTYDPADYIKKVTDIQGSSIYGTYNGTFGGKSVQVTLDLNKNQFTINPDISNSSSTEITVAFIYTDQGVRFYEPITVNGLTVSEFTYDYNAGTLTGTATNGTSCVLTGVLPQGYRKFADYAGTYTLAYLDANGAALQKTVTLTADEPNSCFYMTGLFDTSTIAITLNYSKSLGCLYWNSQKIGTESSNQIWLCAWALSGTSGSLTWDTSAGMKTVWNGDTATPIYNLVDNALSSYTITSYYVYTLNSSGKAGVGAYSGSTYLIDGGIRLRHVLSLTKK